MLCPNCKNRIPNDSTFCPYCGSEITATNNIQANVSINDHAAEPTANIKKRVPSWVIACIGILLSVIIIAVIKDIIASAKPKASDAVNYVQAAMDLLCTGKHDASVQFADAQDGEFDRIRNQIIDDFVNSMGRDGFTLYSDTKARLRSMMITALANCLYKATTAAESGDGYDVEVVVAPLRLYANEKRIDDMITQRLSDDPNEKTDDDIYNMYLLAMCEVIEDDLSIPIHEHPVTVTVHYGRLSDGGYGVTYTDGKRIGENLFTVVTEINWENDYIRKRAAESMMRIDKKYGPDKYGGSIFWLLSLSDE